MRSTAALLAAALAPAASRTGAHRAEFASHSSPLGRPTSMPEPEPEPRPQRQPQPSPAKHVTNSQCTLRLRFCVTLR